MSNEEFQNSFDNATLQIIQKLATNMETACLLIERDAKINCPVDMGPLRAAMFHEVGLSDGLLKGTVANSMEYAPYVHQGTGIYAVNGDGRQTPWGYAKNGEFHWTHGQKPQPFLEDSKISNISRITRLLAGV